MTSLVNQYLREMGIEVWVLRANIRPEIVDRGTAPKSAALDAARSTGSSETLAPVSPPSGTTTGPGAVPEFHLCWLHGSGVSLVFALPLDADAALQPVRRFAEDVLLALTGKPATATHALRWPMVQSRHIDQSDAAAKVVVKQRVDQCAPVLLAFGDEAVRLVGDVSPRQRIDLEDIGTYLQSPLSKRDLWQALIQAGEGMNR